MLSRNYLISHTLLVVAVALGYFLYGTVGATAVIILAALEVSLSFDNAVVNAKVLNTMDKKWQDRFIWFGMPIAVFGMRFLLPILIVAIAAGLSFTNAFDMAVTTPEDYHHILESNQSTIFAFGSAFLLQVFLSFTFDDNEHTWIKPIEESKFIQSLKGLDNFGTTLTVFVGTVLSFFTNDVTIALAFFGGVLLYASIEAVDGLLSTDGIKSGIAGFIYLEILDASFSFDGVISSFAISNNIYIIMLGLGVGAMYVRSMTIDFVEKGTLAEYKYLEHGAHYAIGVLSILLITKMFVAVPEIITGGVGIVFILSALVHSIYENKQAK
jgi:hypothetical protein